MENTNRTLFPVGRVYVTDDARAVLDETQESLTELLIRHQLGDWGIVNPEARAWNERALLTEAQYVRSVYRLKSGDLLKVITDEQRTSPAVTLM